MFDEKSRELSRLLFLLDLLLTLLMFLVAFWVRDLFMGDNEADFYDHVALLPIIWIPLSLSMRRFGAYKGLRIVSIRRYAQITLKSLAISFAVLAGLMFLLKIGYVSRSLLAIFVLLDLVVLVGIRAALVWWYFRRSVQKGENYLKVVVIGSGNRARRLSEILRKHAEWGIHIVGYLDPDPANVGKEIGGAKVIGTVDQIGEVMSRQVIDEVILAVPRRLIGDLETIFGACEEQGVRFRFMADVFDLHIARTRLVDLDGVPLLTFEPVAQDEEMLLVKRLMDLTLVLLAMPLVLPILILTALAIKLDSPGPVLFVQQRVGLHKRIFPMLKFRSMVVDAEARMKEIEHLNEASGPNFKIAHDPRVTRVGQFIRKTSIDELPQLFNVLRGQMSLVGPRPMSLRDVDLFDRGIQRKRFSVRPGLTCLWQISGRSDLTFDQWLELDLEYIDNWSLWLDLKILFKTVPVVLAGSGAV